MLLLTTLVSSVLGSAAMLGARYTQETARAQVCGLGRSTNRGLSGQFWGGRHSAAGQPRTPNEGETLADPATQPAPSSVDEVKGRRMSVGATLDRVHSVRSLKNALRKSSQRLRTDSTDLQTPQLGEAAPLRKRSTTLRTQRSSWVILQDESPAPPPPPPSDEQAVEPPTVEEEDHGSDRNSSPMLCQAAKMFAEEQSKYEQRLARARRHRAAAAAGSTRGVPHPATMPRDHVAAQDSHVFGSASLQHARRLRA